MELAFYICVTITGGIAMWLKWTIGNSVSEFLVNILVKGIGLFTIFYAWTTYYMKYL